MKTNLKAARKMTSYTQEDVAEITGIPLGTLRRWEQGVNEPDMASVVELANLYGVSTDTILGSDFADDIPGAIKVRPIAHMVSVPLLGRIAAGQPIEMDEVDNYFEIPQAVYDRWPNSFFLTVDGDSMNRAMPNGSYALINPVDEVIHDGKPYAVCVNGYDATIKRVRRLNNGFELIPDSTDPTYKATTYNFNDPSTETITIIGEVVWLAIPYDWSF